MRIYPVAVVVVEAVAVVAGQVVAGRGNRNNPDNMDIEDIAVEVVVAGAAQVLMAYSL